MEQVYTRHKAESRSISGVYGSVYEGDAGFERIRADVEAFAEAEGRRPRMLVVKLGQDGHDRGAKVIATAFADIGFDVDIGPLFQTPEEAARQAIENDVHVIGISSQAAGHKTLVPGVIQALKAEGADDILWRRHPATGLSRPHSHGRRGNLWARHQHPEGRRRDPETHPQQPSRRVSRRSLFR